MVLQLPKDAVEVCRMAGIDVDERPEAERPVSSQLRQADDQLVLAFVSIQMPLMTFARREALGRDLWRTDAVDFDDLSRQRRQPARGRPRLAGDPRVPPERGQHGSS